MKQVIDFLKENHVMTLATTLGDKPRASTVDYYMVDDSIIFATDPNSIKANNLRHNKRISLSVFNMPRFVAIDGMVVSPTKGEVEGYTKRLFEVHPDFKEMVAKGMMRSFIYFKVVIDTAYFNDYSKGMVPTEVIMA